MQGNVDELMAKRHGIDIEKYQNIQHAIKLWEDKSEHTDFWYRLDTLKRKIEDYQVTNNHVRHVVPVRSPKKVQFKHGESGIISPRKDYKTPRTNRAKGHKTPRTWNSMILIDEEDQHDDKTEFQLMAEQAGPTDQVKLDTRPDSDEKPIAEVNPDEE